MPFSLLVSGAQRLLRDFFVFMLRFHGIYL